MNEELLKKAIDECNVVTILVDTFEKGIIERICIPFDIGPSRKYKDGRTRYHFCDLNSPDGKHVLSILPEQLLKIVISDKAFDPANYITWRPNWFYKRNWGQFS